MSVTKRVLRSYQDLAAWRDAKGLSQTEAADLLGIPQSTYSRLERRANPTTGKRAKAIMAITGVPLEVLVGAA